MRHEAPSCACARKVVGRTPWGSPHQLGGIPSLGLDSVALGFSLPTAGRLSLLVCFLNPGGLVGLALRCHALSLRPAVNPGESAGAVVFVRQAVRFIAMRRLQRQELVAA